MEEKKTYKKIRKKLEKALDENRYDHTLGVAKTSQMLAVFWDVDSNKAYLAGLLHDCAKNIPYEEKIKLCEREKVTITKIEEENPALLHSKVGAIVAKYEYEIDDEDILMSIRSHTTGRPDMSMLEKIVFVADYIEPGRNERPELINLRKLAFIDIDLCVEAILFATLNYLKDSAKAVDPATKTTYEYYCELNRSKR